MYLKEPRHQQNWLQGICGLRRHWSTYTGVHADQELRCPLTESLHYMIIYKYQYWYVSCLLISKDDDDDEDIQNIKYNLLSERK